MFLTWLTHRRLNWVLLVAFFLARTQGTELCRHLVLRRANRKKSLRMQKLKTAKIQKKEKKKGDQKYQNPKKILNEIISLQLYFWPADGANMLDTSLSFFNPKVETVDAITVWSISCNPLLQYIINGFVVHGDPTGYVSACFQCRLGHTVAHLHSTAIQLSSHIHPPLEVCALLTVRCVIFRVVSMRGRNVQISSFGPQHIRQDYPQAARRLSRLFVRFSCHSSSGWQRHCPSDPSSFSRLFSSITSDQTTCQSERNCTVFSNIKLIQRRIWEILDHFFFVLKEVLWGNFPVNCVLDCAWNENLNYHKHQQSKTTLIISWDILLCLHPNKEWS